MCEASTASKADMNLSMYAHTQKKKANDGNESRVEISSFYIFSSILAFAQVVLE